jgi:enterochelin esterase-like enzyme
MRRRRFSWGSLFWSAVQIAIGGVILLQVAHWRLQSTASAGGPDGRPTADALAFVDRTIPATYTPRVRTTIVPGATFFATPAATSTLPPDAEVPQSGPPPTVTPTPFAVPDYLKQPVTVYDLAEPPTTTECGDHGFVYASQFPSPIWGGDRNYHAYLPPCYGQDGRAYPVLYMIHGSGHKDDMYIYLGLPQHIDQGILEGRYPPFIVIMPDSGSWGDATSGGERSVEGVTIQDLIPWVDSHFCTWNDRRGRSIGGISRGGYWALMMAFRHPDLFTAVSGSSSQLRLETDPAEFNPLATYTTVDLSNMRIWMDWGERDFLRAGQQLLHELLMNAGIAHSVKISPGNHANYYWFEHMGEYMDWHAQSWPLAREAYPPCAPAVAQ